MSTPGPGDPETWPPYTNHALDPRNDEEEEREPDVEALAQSRLDAAEDYGY